MSIEHLFANNKAWAASVIERDPQFFKRLSGQQTPRFLWIGCSDSRVPANEIVGLAPGEVFVHRNVANVVVHSDLNCLSAMQFSVDHLKVQDILVCGHYGCGGVLAALKGMTLGLADNWIRHVQDVRNGHAREVAQLPEAQQHDRLCELNVIAQVRNVCQTTVVQDAWRRGQPLAVHGVIYGLNDGLLQNLHAAVTDAGSLDAILQAALEPRRPA
ncbi:MAG: carbonate dehydratase [Gemmatimonadota bacterium]